MYKNKIFTGVKNKIILWDKIHIIKEYSISEEEFINNSNKDIDGQIEDNFHYTKFLIFDQLILASASTGELFLFDIQSGNLLKKINLGCDLMIHPPTYLNKIIFTKKSQFYEEDMMLNNTKLFIYNINTEKQIFEINFDKHLENSSENSNIKITFIEQSPIIDVIGIGFNTGEILLYNIKQDKKILYFKTETAVKSLSFSSCVELNLSLLSSSDSRGNIQLWDLNKEILCHTIKAKNDSFVINSLIFLPMEPLLLATSGNGNFIKMYKLEANIGTPSILKMRSGHSIAPHKIRFYGGEQVDNNFNNHLLSISNGEFRNVSMINEHLSRDFSLKSFPKDIKHILKINSNLKYNSNNNNFNNDDKKSLSQEELEKILANNFSDFDFNEFRERDWSNILIKITNSPWPLLFSYENSSISEKKVQIKNTESNCTAVCVSMCGNFGFSGHENGSIEKFNMQSGLNKWTISNAHSKPIISLKSDSINSLLVTVGLDQKLNFWEIFQSTLVKSIELPSTPTLLELYRDNDLIAVACNNYDIYVYDKSNFKMVRKLENFFKGKLNDVAFANSGKWICAVSEDKSLKIFDIISNNLIEWIEFKNIPLSLSVSPTSQYFALSFSNKKGVFIWLNRTVFAEFIDLDSNKVVEPIKVNMPLNNFIRKLKTRKEIAEKEAQDKIINEINKNEKNKKKKELEIIQEDNKELIILSKENRLKYRILNNLEKIQQRSEPQIKKKEKTKAPFFLFNINDLFGNTNKNKDKQVEITKDFLSILKNYTHFKNEKILKDKTESENNLLNKKELILIDLLDAYKEKNVKSNEITLFLNSLNPYLIDLEIRNLDPFLNVDVKNSINSNKYLEFFIDYLDEEIQERNNFEMIQAYLNRFLKVFLKFFKFLNFLLIFNFRILRFLY